MQVIVVNNRLLVSADFQVDGEIRIRALDVVEITKPSDVVSALKKQKLSKNAIFAMDSQELVGFDFSISAQLDAKILQEHLQWEVEHRFPTQKNQYEFQILRKNFNLDSDDLVLFSFGYPKQILKSLSSFVFSAIAPLFISSCQFADSSDSKRKLFILNDPSGREIYLSDGGNFGSWASFLPARSGVRLNRAIGMNANLYELNTLFGKSPSLGGIVVDEIILCGDHWNSKSSKFLHDEINVPVSYLSEHLNVLCMDGVALPKSRWLVEATWCIGQFIENSPAINFLDDKNLEEKIKPVKKSIPKPKKKDAPEPKPEEKTERTSSWRMFLFVSALMILLGVAFFYFCPWKTKVIEFLKISTQTHQGYIVHPQIEELP